MKHFALTILILLSTPSFAADLPCVGAGCVDNPLFRPAPGGGGVRPQAGTREQAPAEKPASATNPSGANAQIK
jgi:hypothetical protein